ncbi:hypothetical protein AUH73_00180 [archaeon 13_1_40CM_4_53_4]|nr:MAG: hypothetical protein AUH73_00180 [archaeon 13_1_40CM_4_53_4]
MRWGAAGLSNPGFPATPAFDSLNIFSASSGPEFNLLNEIYEPLFRENPYSPTQLINWMGNFYRVETHATQPAECPAVYLAVAVGACLKMVLRGDISWHDIFNCAATDPVCLASHVVTANDVKFSFAAFSAATGSPIGSNTQNVIDVVYNPAVLPSAAYAGSGGGSARHSSSTSTIILLLRSTTLPVFQSFHSIFG